MCRLSVKVNPRRTIRSGQRGNEHSMPSTCAKCGHSNANTRITKTLFTRRLKAVCYHLDEAVTGMAGSDVCLCAGEFHQQVIAQVSDASYDELREPSQQNRNYRLAV